MLNADKNLLMEKIKIGNSDYTKQQMEQGVYGWGTSAREYIETIKQYENEGYTVKFETSIWRKIFGIGIYKVVAYR
jgi:hypothetical protein